MEILNRYGITGTFRLLISLVYTKVFFRKARIIRLPFDIRNKRLIKIGDNLTTGTGCRIEAHQLEKGNKYSIEIGNNVQMNDYVHIVGGKKVIIGNNVLLASKIFISDLNHGSYGTNDVHDSPETLPVERKLAASQVVIEDNVWIGEFVSILPGVTIGRGSIIGTMSVVTKSIPAYSIAVGSPAVVIKQYDFTSQQWVKIK